MVAGCRLHAAEETLPGLSSAVVSRVADAMASDNYRERLRIQFQNYSSPSEHHRPDAYLYGEQTVEEALQHVACAGRTARLRMGQSGDPGAWEERLAGLLLDDPEVPLAMETRRVPRPAVPAPPQLEADRWGGPATATTLSVEPADVDWLETLITVRGWPLIATVEHQMVQHPDHLDRRELAVMRYRVPELRNSRDPSPPELLPATGDIRRWIEDPRNSSTARPIFDAMPLFGLDFSGAHAGDGREGLGIQTHVLTPTAELLVMLGLRPAEPFMLDDNQGGGLALVTWRASYDEGAFSMPRPRLIGSGVTAHPDLARRLIATTDDKLVIRDFVAEVPI